MGFLTGKTAIITGGGRAVLSNGECGSIGYGIATAYAKEGANLVLTGRNVQKLTDAKEELEKKYGCSIEELYEGDLEEIVLEKEGTVAESARYDPQFDCIVFKYYEEAC